MIQLFVMMRNKITEFYYFLHICNNISFRKSRFNLFNLSEIFTQCLKSGNNRIKFYNSFICTSEFSSSSYALEIKGNFFRMFQNLFQFFSDKRIRHI